MSIDVSVQELFDVGAHFGHQTNKWNPKMRPFIFGTRSGLHIIDIQQTVNLAQKAFKFLEDVVAGGQDVLFVGTKRQAQEVVEQESMRCQMHCITQRWLGGALTNFPTIKKSIDRLIELETRREKNDFAGFTKKELLNVDRTIAKLKESLGGIRRMRKTPGALFIVDPSLEKIAVHEAKILGIPVIAMADSNCDPDPIDFIIPANDDALRSVQLVVSRVADACLAGLERRETNARKEDNRKNGEDKGRSARRAKEVGGTGTAYVSKADSFDGAKAQEGFSATATKKEEATAKIVTE